MLEPYVLKGTRTVPRRGEISNYFLLFDKFIVCFAGYSHPLKYQYEEEHIKKTSIGVIRYPMLNREDD